MILRNLTRLSTVVFACVWASMGLAAGIDLDASVDREECVVGERITYTLTVTGGVTSPEVIPPDFDDFDIVSGPSTSTSIQMVNGSISRSQSLTYILRPKKAGRFIIEAAKAKHKRHTYSSRSIRISVHPPGAPPTSGSSRKSSSSLKTPHGDLPEVFIVAEADKDTAYRLEMITVVYKLYLRVNVQGYNIVDLPRATGFWTEDFSMPSRPSVQDVTIQGRPYKYAEIRKVGLFPTRTGELTLDPLTADITVERRSSRRRSRDSFFDDPFFSRSRREVVSTSTEPLALTILPTPAAGRPAGFRGDVGDYRLNVKYDKAELDQHDALTVEVTISGEGYLKSVDAPQLDLPTGFEQFDPTQDQNITTAGGSVRGRKTFTYLVIPRRSGSFQLEPIVFSFFDPQRRQYRTVQDGGMLLRVRPAEGDISGGGYHNPEEVAILDSDVRFIRELSEPLVKVTAPFYRSPWFFVTLAISPLLFLMGLGMESVIEKRLSDPAAVSRRRAPEQMRLSLKEAGKLAKQGEATRAIDLVGKGFAEMVGAVIREPAAGLTTELIESKLSELGSDDSLIRETAGLMSEADRVRFSGGRLDAAAIEKILIRFRVAAASLEKMG